MSNLCIGTNKVNEITHVSIQEKGDVIVSGFNDTCIRGLAIRLSRNQATGSKACINRPQGYNRKIECHIKEGRKSEKDHELN